MPSFSPRGRRFSCRCPATSRGRSTLVIGIRVGEQQVGLANIKLGRSSDGGQTGEKDDGGT